MKKTLLLALAAAACAASPILASEIVPSQPLAFEPVNLRMTVDSCAFVPATVQVRAAANVLKVAHQQNQCLVAGPPEVVDIRLGALAPGEYRVEVFPSLDTDGPPSESLAFQVSERASIAVFPPPPRPLTDYTGMWWNPQESGWGLALHQSARSDALFGAWFAYGQDRQPEWFTLQGGQWTSATRWTGTVYRTTGPWFAGAFDPSQVQLEAVGSAVLDFRQVPGDTGAARFTYPLPGGGSATRVLTRTVF